MGERRKLYTGDETAARGLLLLRLASTGSLLITILFIVFFDRAKHDPAFAAVNPFAEDPYDAVGSFGVQLALACAIISQLRAARAEPKTESLYNRYTYTLRAIAVAQLAIIVTLLGDVVASVHNVQAWMDLPQGRMLVGLAVGLLLLASGFCVYLIRLARRREVCSKNPLVQRQMLPFLILLVLLVMYPGSWREGTAGAILTAAAGMVYLFASVALLSKAMFPCPDIPERDLIDDMAGVYNDLKLQLGSLFRPGPNSAHPAGPARLGKVLGLFNPRKHEWNLLGLFALLVGLLLAIAGLFLEGPAPDVGRAFFVAIVIIALESLGVLLGYAMFRRFLGLIRSPSNP